MSPTPQDEPQCIEAHKFTTIPRACKLINQQALRLLEDTSRKQYLLFHPVSASQFTTLDEGRFDGRHIIPKKTRLSYNTATSTLVVKLMASPKHDTAALILSMEIKSKLESFGVPLSAFLPVGAAKRQGKYTAKQPDASFKPSFRGENGWPSLVIESGLSESLVQLRRDAAWWLTNSDEQVRIALVTSIQKNDRSIVVEVWEMKEQQPDEARRTTRSSSQPTPTQLQEIRIEKNGKVTGGPLVLGFERMLVREPGGGEGDVVFSAAELRAWAGLVWSA
ncbi:hypothetical protein VE00_07989 [Pseudogymnoascus sp. WSF 3629]|nr:hypothetical protein VE00_07989 [Pseudogymnoascus sp. WSF 3629]